MKKSYLLLFCFSIFFVGCNKSPIGINDLEQTSVDPVYNKIVSLGFDATSIEDFGDYYVAEGDIAFNKTGSVTSAKKTAQFIPTNSLGTIVNYSKQTNIRYFIDTSIPSNSTWRTVIPQALAMWTNISGCKITFTQTTNINNRDLLIISDLGLLPSTTYALGWLPVSGMPGISIALNMDACAGFSATKQKMTIVHEAGHCIGLMHTNYKSVPEELGFTYFQIPFTPATDANSVMNQYNGIDKTVFSSNDLIAAKTMYPEATYSQRGTGDWTGTKAMAYSSPNLYIMQGEKLYKTTPSTGAWVQIGNNVWPSTVAIAATSTNVYVVSDSKLWKVNISTGVRSRLGTDAWSTTKGMVYYSNYLYIVDGNKLWKTSPTDGTWVQLGTEDWSNTSAMTLGSTNLYIMKNNRIRKANISTGISTQVGTANWATAAKICYRNSKLYLTADEIYVIDPSTGLYIRQALDSWTGTEAIVSVSSDIYAVQGGKLWFLDFTNN
jgi:Dual-action HEIGH metallo-peptidase